MSRRGILRLRHPRRPALFDRKFELMGRLLSVGFDLYAYATFTAPSSGDVAGRMRWFVDRLQALDENLPLRTVPLEVRVFTPVGHRLDDVKRSALENQKAAVGAWQREIEDRFSSDARRSNISEVPLRIGSRLHE